MISTSNAVEPTTEQRALAESVRALLAAGHPDPWPRLCAEIGVAALEIPEEYGGFGAGIAETQVVLEELGRVLAPGPMLGSVVLAGQALLASRDEAACARLLPDIASGEATAALAWTGVEGDWAAPALRVEDGRLSGTAHYVLDGAEAHILLALADTGDGTGLFELSAGADVRAVPTLDPGRPLARVTVDRVPATRIGGELGAELGPLRDRACLALAAESLGAAAHCLEQTVAYCGQRVQFGRPIGSFQAIKHRLADAHVQLEAARSACYAAAAEPGPERAAIARIQSSEAFSAIAAEMIQLHGGIAITAEHEAHHYFKRAHGSAVLFGQPRAQLARLGANWLSEPVPT
ncbi:acyl-CoA dehydrogenase family protein [Sciscionella marina]|uniref:acyl-CoA dehydrogenase family protein n=1 Tax=Sciscionella marina TaxID=508770 RepID=UPI000360F415|nr:acyl-CoA dehydrogenase family protein [Sciscionella marina]